MSKTSSASFDDNVLRLAGGAGVVKGAVLIAAPTQALRVAFKVRPLLAVQRLTR